MELFEAVAETTTITAVKPHTQPRSQGPTAQLPALSLEASRRRLGCARREMRHSRVHRFRRRRVAIGRRLVVVSAQMSRTMRKAVVEAAVGTTIGEIAVLEAISIIAQR